MRKSASFALIRRVTFNGGTWEKAGLTAQKEFFCGKVVSKIFYREFNFPKMKAMQLNKAVLWMTHELSVDKTAIDFLADQIRAIVFTDMSRKESYSISLKKFMEIARLSEYGAGTQYYIPLEAPRRIIFRPQRYIRNKLYI